MFNNYTTPTHTEESLMAKPTKAPFGYYGAKLRIAKKIIDLLPPHNAWVEGFCGSAALTLAKLPAPIEIINDADGEVVNLFKQLRDNSEELCRSVALTPYSRQEFVQARSRQEGLDELERARRFLVATMMTINATNGSQQSGFSFSQSYARQNREARVNRWYNLPERLEKVVERLRGIRIENRDACDLIEMFIDRPATLIYLDPPYFIKRKHGYVIDANNIEFHEKLLGICKRARCMILISAYDNEIYRDMLSADSGWSIKKIETHTRDTTGKNFARTELFWMNDALITAKERNKVPIRLNKHEKTNKKVNPPRKQ